MSDALGFRHSGWFLIIALWISIGLSNGAVHAREPFRYETRTGIVVASPAGEVCLSIEDPSLAVGERITIVQTWAPQSTAEAKVTKKRPDQCANRDPSDRETNYALQLRHGTLRPHQVTIGLSNVTVPFRVANDVVSADLDQDGQREYFRACTSTEGLHLTVWSRMPLAGVRRWHRYYYLGYDVEPTCTTKDYE